MDEERTQDKKSQFDHSLQASLAIIISSPPRQQQYPWVFGWSGICIKILMRLSPYCTLVFNIVPANSLRLLYLYLSFLLRQTISAITHAHLWTIWTMISLPGGISHPQWISWIILKQFADLDESKIVSNNEDIFQKCGPFTK